MTQSNEAKHVELGGVYIPALTHTFAAFTLRKSKVLRRFELVSS